MNVARAEVRSIRGASFCLLAGLVLVAWRSPKPSLEGARVESNDGTYVVHYELLPAELEVRELFELRVILQRADGEAAELELAVDARMPEHGHGMNREPELARAEDGALEVRNMLFHMPGYWELYFDVTEGAVTERAQVTLDLE